MDERTSFSLLAVLAAMGIAAGCETVQTSMRPYVAVPPAPPQPDYCQLDVKAGPLPTPGPGVTPVAHLECRYQAVTDQPTCRQEIAKMACRSGSNTLAGIQESPGFIAAEALYVAPTPVAMAPPQPAAPTGPQPGDPLPPDGGGTPPGAIAFTPTQPQPGQPLQPMPGQAPAATAAPAAPAPTAAPQPPQPPPPPAVPATLSREDVASGMNGVKSSVQQCMREGSLSATVNVSVEIAGTGRVSNATVEGAAAGTPAAACIEAAVLGASFRTFTGRAITVRYPYPAP